MNNIEVLDRLADIVEISLSRKPYDKDITQALGMPPLNYSKMKQKNCLPLEAIITYCAKQRININWVLFEQSSKMLEEKTEAVYKIRFLENINGSAGAGAFNDDNNDFTFLSINPSGGIDLISDNKSYPVTTMPAEEIMVSIRLLGLWRRYE